MNQTEIIYSEEMKDLAEIIYEKLNEKEKRFSLTEIVYTTFANKDWLTVLPIDKLLSKAIYESCKVGGSISQLFEG